MNRKNFILGISMGLAVGGFVAMMMRPKKHCVKSALGRTLKTLGDIVDSVSDGMGW